MRHRGYSGPDDVARLQAFNAEAVAVAGYPGHLHTGDIPHRMFNALRWEQIEECLHVWEEDGEIVAWGLVYPGRRAGIDLQVRPDARTADLERDLVAWLTAAALPRAEVRDGVRTVGIDVGDGEEIRAGAAAAAGYSATDSAYFLTQRPIADIPEAAVSSGYSIRSVVGPSDAAALAAVHAGSFGSRWTPERYEWLMTTPGYDPDRELVAVAPDSTFAAFTVTWHDHRNGTGLFEPVGTHADHRRRGLARAVMAEGMRRMAAAGLSRALVAHEADNPASTALYRHLGFRPIAHTTVWRLARNEA